jgi:hypothetical protein
MGVNKMSNKISLEGCYTVAAYAEIELPEGKTGKDIRHVYDKWGTLYIELDDGKVYEHMIDYGDVDSKRLDYMDLYTDERELLNV